MITTYLTTYRLKQRAALGVFLAMQYPVEIPGVNNAYFLRTALNSSLRKEHGEAPEFDAFDFLAITIKATLKSARLLG